MRTADRQRGKVRTKFADPVRILPLRVGFGKVRSPHFTPAFDNTKWTERKDLVAGLENGFEKT